MITATWSATSASARTISGRWRTCPVNPAMLTAAVKAITPATITRSAHPCVNPSQIGLR
jgi:hypothetical protein